LVVILILQQTMVWSTEIIMSIASLAQIKCMYEAFVCNEKKNQAVNESGHQSKQQKM